MRSLSPNLDEEEYQVILCITEPIIIIKSKLLVFGAVSTTIHDQGCQHVTERSESIKMPLNKSAGWPTFVQSHLSVKTVE